MWAAGMSEKSKVTRNIFTTVWLGLNKVWGQDKARLVMFRCCFPIPTPILPHGKLTTWMVPTLGTL